MNIKSASKNPLNLIVVVAALGYFVDVYDLLLFSVVRKASLIDLGFSGSKLLDKGAVLLNYQMIGMLLGGILWGILGDKKGRVSVLFASIIIYSVANLLNGMVQTFDQYAMLRFIAGVGLAGELGVGITLVNETMTKEHRGYGTTIVASFGILGAVLAALIGKNFHWQTAYYIGGGLGIILLALRLGVYESGMYEKTKAQIKNRGNFFQLFASRKIFFKYMSCVFIGLPIWYVVGILITFSPEFGKAMGLADVSAANVVLISYIGLSIGDLVCGLLSQYFKSRKKVMMIYLWFTTLMILVFLLGGEKTYSAFYILSGVLGFSAGYWAVLVTNASEQFGTNLRSTVTTTTPNFVRGAIVPILMLFNFFKDVNINGSPMGIINSALIVGGLTMLIAFLSLAGTEEAYGKDLDYIEK